MPLTPAPLLALTDRCVQCGLCLPTCPTYRLEGLEAESPRGRIALARAWELGTIGPTATGEAHLDQCLGCRSCEAVCPAGVEYGALLVHARARQRERRPPGLRQRLLEWLVARPRALAGALGLYRYLHPLLPKAWRALPRPPAARSDTLPATGALALFRGCVAGPYEAGLREATARLCAAAGIELALPPGQACCGAVHAHAGDIATTATLAARNRQAFAASATVLTVASGCHDSLADALHGCAETRDALGFLAAHAGRLAFLPCNERIALHLPCTQRNVVRGDAATRALLARVPGLEVVELDAGYGCCGAAGTQMATDPARAARFRQPLLDQLRDSGATRLLSANIGCRLHFANAAGVPIQHPLEFLAALSGSRLPATDSLPT
ncbi:MAG: heterodisulfide reductase-related iron-sulfur binding cluster [Pseudomonadota bacterium]|nr:heterodisulfide reductase-related iron-sulfur binding cluster [Pseudomonadota bacterium]